jgi:hypothetical protein
MRARYLAPAKPLPAMQLLAPCSPNHARFFSERVRFQLSRVPFITNPVRFEPFRIRFTIDRGRFGLARP